MTIKVSDNSLNLNYKIDEIEVKDNDLYKYMKVKNFIPAGEPIQIEIYIPKKC